MINLRSVSPLPFANDHAIGVLTGCEHALRWLPGFGDRKSCGRKHRSDGSRIPIEGDAPDRVGIAEVDAGFIAAGFFIVVGEDDPDQAAPFDARKGGRAERLRRGEVRMGGDVVANAVRAILPAVIDACQALASDEAKRETHPAMRASVIPGADHARCASPDGKDPVPSTLARSTPPAGRSADSATGVHPPKPSVISGAYRSHDMSPARHSHVSFHARCCFHASS